MKHKSPRQSGVSFVATSSEDTPVAFLEISIDDPSIEDYWRAGILYVDHTPEGKACFGITGTASHWVVDKTVDDEYSPKYYKRGLYKYAILLEE